MLLPLPRLLTTLMPLVVVLLLIPLHHRDTSLWVGLSQCLLLGWTAQRIRQREAQVGKTAATWVWIGVLLLTVCFSFLLWFFSHLAL